MIPNKENRIIKFLILNPNYEIDPLILNRQGELKEECTDKQIRLAYIDFIDTVRDNTQMNLEMMYGKVKDVYRETGWESQVARDAIKLRNALYEMVDIRKLMLSRRAKRTEEKNG